MCVHAWWASIGMSFVCEQLATPPIITRGAWAATVIVYNAVNCCMPFLDSVTPLQQHINCRAFLRNEKVVKFFRANDSVQFHNWKPRSPYRKCPNHTLVTMKPTP